MKFAIIVGLALTLPCSLHPPASAAQGARTLSAGDLCQKALSADELGKRVNAAVELSMLKTSDVATHLRRLAGETKDAEVLVPALAGLMLRSNFDSLPLFINALESEAKPVREVAIQGVLKLTGLSAAQVQYSADDAKEKRGKAVQMLKERLEKGKAKSPP